MTLWQRAPREVYRVYGQDEYLAEQDGEAREDHRSSSFTDIEEKRSARPASEPGRDSRTGRLVGLVVLVGVTVGVVGLVVSSTVHRSPPAQRSAAAQRAQVARAQRTGGAPDRQARVALTQQAKATASKDPQDAVSTNRLAETHAHGLGCRGFARAPVSSMSALQISGGRVSSTPACVLPGGRRSTSHRMPSWDVSNAMSPWPPREQIASQPSGFEASAVTANDEFGFER